MLRHVAKRLARNRWAWLVLDAAVWGAAVWVAAGVRRLYVHQSPEPVRVAAAASLALALHLALGALAGLYRHGRVRGSYEEVVRLAQVTAAVTALLALVVLVPPGVRLVPGTVPVLAGALALTAMLALRLLVRTVRSRTRLHVTTAPPVIVAGAGVAGSRLVRHLVEQPDAGYHPVALIDDDPATHAQRRAGVPVRGGRDALADLAGRLDVGTLVIAMPSAPADVVRGLADLAHHAGLTTLVLPPRRPDDSSTVRLRRLEIEDLVGRRRVEVDDTLIAEQITGRTVLITGAGGSVGAEICRQVAGYAPGSLVLLDHDESAMNAVLVDLFGREIDVPCHTVLADIRDREAVRRHVEEHRPQIVVHAAGLQNVSMLERSPVEAWKTNVIGTLNVLEAAAAHHVLAFVNLSTDKAQDPTHTLGFSRRIAERLTTGFDERYPGRYMSVRFGNIYGATGSIGLLFEAQIRHGGPLTVSHPNAAQQFMLIPEACRLSLHAMAAGAGGEVMCLDMGPATKVVDVARALMRLRGRPDLEIAFTGLRPGQPPKGVRESPPGSAPTGHALIRAHAISRLDDLTVRDIDDRLAASSALMRYLAVRMGPDEPGPSPDEPSWEHIEAEWSRDVLDDAPHDAFAAALLGVPAAHRLIDRQAEDARRIVATLGVDPPAAVPVEDPVVELDPIYLSKADVSPLEEKWVLKAMRSGYVAPLGPMVDEFERRVAQRVGVKHALALSSGTAALHLLLMHVGAREGRYVVVPTMTFAATVNAVMYTGATPYFVDVQECDGNLDVDLMLAAVDELQAAGHSVAAVLSVDLFGRCCDYTRIEPSLVARGVPLIEDAAEALGASHAGRAAGSFGLGAALSFNGNKIMTTSGGGMLLSDDGDLIDRARYLSTQARQPVPWYEHDDVGYNYRLSNVLAGLGIAQFSRLDSMIARRRDLRGQYARLAAHVPGGRLLGGEHGVDDVDDNCWLTSLVYDVSAVGTQVDDLVARLGADRIEARHLWKPLHSMSAYAGSSARLSGVAERLFACGVNLPSGSALRDEDVERVTSALTRLLCRTAVGAS